MILKTNTASGLIAGRKDQESASSLNQYRAGPRFVRLPTRLRRGADKACQEPVILTMADMRLHRDRLEPRLASQVQA